MNRKTVLSVHELEYAVRGCKILKKVSLEVKEGEFVGVIGPNGSGKSTLLKNIYKIAVPDGGRIYVNGCDLAHMTNRQMAREIAVVAQENNTNFDFTVEEVVAMGRYPHKKMMEPLSDSDIAAVQQMVRTVEMEDFLKSSFLNLSGGEKQRVLIARALVQDTGLVVLDEPTNHLDVGSQIRTLQLMKNSGKTILAALHDLGIASKYCDRIYVMCEGKILCGGRPDEMINAELIEKLYGIHAEVFGHHGRTFIDYQ